MTMEQVNYPEHEWQRNVPIYIPVRYQALGWRSGAHRKDMVELPSSTPFERPGCSAKKRVCGITFTVVDFPLLPHIDFKSINRDMGRRVYSNADALAIDHHRQNRYDAIG